MVRAWTQTLPLHGLGAGSGEDGSAEVDYRPRLLGQAHQFIGRDRPTVGMGVAQQCFGTGDLPGDRIHNGLVGQPPRL